jgi:hypothetical protein
MLSSRPTTVLGRNGVTTSLLCTCPDLWYIGTPVPASSGAHCPCRSVNIVFLGSESKSSAIFEERSPEPVPYRKAGR